MKKVLTLVLFCILASVSQAITGDALKNVLLDCNPSSSLSLNGTWQLKVINGITSDKSVPPADATWKSIPVPGCWETYGFCEPRYNYPDSLTGYYRTSFTVPAGWQGQRIIIRFDGVLRGYNLWLNGKEVGTWESAFNTCLFDLTPYLTRDAFRGGKQELALRVYSQYKGYEFDCNDDWAPMGIFRDVKLFSVPETHLADYMVETQRVEGSNAEVLLSFKVAEATKHTTLSLELTDPQGNAVGKKVTLRPNRDGSATYLWQVSQAQLWTAETPSLYSLKAQLLEKGKPLQTLNRKIGIRKMTIDGRVVRINGKPIKFRGVTCHSTDPYTVKVISDSLTLKDMKLMKEASVNYIRTSHYPREPRFYDLADSLGFYVVSEVPFGYGDKHLKDTTYQDILYTRARATVNRDKAHACVMVWSVGNENPFTEMERKTGKEVKKTDPTRPICFPQRGSTFRDLINKGYVFPADVDIYAPHYPATEQLSQFYKAQDRPLLFTEYCHTLGTAFEDHDLQWEIIQNNEGMLGGSVWEWVDQGMPFKQPLRQRYGKEERVFTSYDGGFMMFGDKGTDGLLYANRVPLPNYYELQHNYAQAFVIDSLTRYDASTGQVSLTLCNRYDFSNLKGVDFQWAFSADGETLTTGHFSPNCPPRSQTTWQLNLPKLSANDDRNPLLHVTITSPQGYRILQQTICLKPSTVTTRLLKTMASEGNPLDCAQSPLMVRAGRKSTLGEDIKIKSRLNRYLLPVSSDGMAGPDSCRIRADIKSETQQEALHVTFSLTPPAQHIFMPELGVALVLDKSLNCIQWIGKGPYATYPGRCQADRYGLWGLRRGDLYLEGNRMGVEAVWATDSIGNGVLIVCKDGNVNFEETDRGLVISVNGAVAGVGPKFQQTTHPVWADKVGTVSGQFWLYRTTSNKLPQSLKQLFINPSEMAKPFHPFETQYDTYPMRLADIMDRHGRP